MVAEGAQTMLVTEAVETKEMPKNRHRLLIIQVPMISRHKRFRLQEGEHNLLASNTGHKVCFSLVGYCTTIRHFALFLKCAC